MSRTAKDRNALTPIEKELALLGVRTPEVHDINKYIKDYSCECNGKCAKCSLISVECIDGNCALGKFSRLFIGSILRHYFIVSAKERTVKIAHTLQPLPVEVLTNILDFFNSCGPSFHVASEVPCSFSILTSRSPFVASEFHLKLDGTHLPFVHPYVEDLNVPAVLFLLSAAVLPTSELCLRCVKRATNCGGSVADMLSPAPAWVKPAHRSAALEPAPTSVGVGAPGSSHGPGVRSQVLNGNNGSWTNSDDVISKKDANDQRKRDKRTAEKNQRHANQTGHKHGAVEYGPEPQDPVVVESVDKKDEMRPEYLVIPSRGRKPLLTFAAFKGEYVTLVEGVWIGAHTGRVFTELVEEGTRMTGYDNDGGALVPVDACQDVVARFPYEWRSGEATGADGNRVQGDVVGFIYKPAWGHLQKKFAASGIQVSVVRGYESQLMIHYPMMSKEVLENTTFAYAKVVRALGERIEAECQLMGGVSFGIPSELDSVRRMQEGRQSVDVLNVGLTRRAYVESDAVPPKDPADRRLAFEVLKSRDAKFVDGALVYKTQRTKPLHEYLVALDLKGEVEFERAAATGKNQRAALVRPFRCRGGTAEFDLAFEGQQLTMLSHLVPLKSWIRRGARMTESRSAYTFKGRNKSKEVPKPTEKPPEFYSILAMNKRIMREYTPTGGYWYMYRLWCKIHEKTTSLARGVLHALGVFWLMFIYHTLFVFYYSDLPHAKRKLRSKLGLDLELQRGCWVNEISAEVKDEPMKFNSYPRLYFSLGPHAPLYGGAQLEMAKKVFSGERVIICKGFVAYINFADMNRPEEMGTLFTWMDYRVHSKEKVVCILVYSDDMALASNIDGEMYWEVDISKCDSSVGVGVFNLVADQLLKLGVSEGIVEGILEQCNKPFRMRNPANKDEYILAQFFGYYLVSGTVLTTYANTWASLMITGAVLATFERKLYDTRSVQASVALVGFEVTVVERSGFPGMTFLKRHPCRDVHGKYEAPICLGAVLRSLGKIVPELSEHVLPGSRGTTPESRAARFLGGILEGWKHEPVQPVFESLRRAFPFMGSVNYNEQAFRQRETTGAALDISDICDRYGITAAEYEMFAGCLGALKLGDRMSSDILTKIFAVDYGAVPQKA